VRSFGDGEVNANSPPINLHARTTLPRLLCVVHVLEVNESKSAAPSGGTVIHDVCARQRSVASKDFFKILLPGIVREIKDSEASALRRIVSISFVSLPVRHGRARPSAAAIGGSAITTSAVTASPRARSRARIAASPVAGTRAGAATTTIAAAAPASAAPVATLLPTLAAGGGTATLTATHAFTPTLAAGNAPLFLRDGSLANTLPGRVGIGIRARRWTPLAA